MSVMACWSSHALPENWQVSWQLIYLGDSLVHMLHDWQAGWGLAKLSAGAVCLPSMCGLSSSRKDYPGGVLRVLSLVGRGKQWCESTFQVSCILFPTLSYWAGSITYQVRALCSTHDQAYSTVGSDYPRWWTETSVYYITARLVKSLNFLKDLITLVIIILEWINKLS